MTKPLWIPKNRYKNEDKDMARIKNLKNRLKQSKCIIDRMGYEAEPESFEAWRKRVHAFMGISYFKIVRLSAVFDYQTGWNKRTRKQKESARKHQLTIK